MPSKDKIEERAVETIRSLINNCDFITHDIPTNDKTPVYDGELRLYRKNSKGLSNENLIGAVPVQVKGKDKSFQNKPKYPIKVSHLNYYQHNGGCLFFVVDTVLKQIYYCELLPVIIYEKFQEKPSSSTQRTLTFPLKKFPEKEEEVYALLTHFYNHSKKQRASNGITQSLGEIFHSGQNISIESELKFEKKDNIMTLKDKPTQLYAKFKPSDAIAPLGSFTITAVGESANAILSIGSNQYQVNVARKISIDPNDIEIELNHNIKIFPYKQTPTLTYSIKDSNLSEAKSTLSILIDLCQENPLYINNQVLGCLNKNKKLLEDLICLNNNLDKIQEVANVLNINTDKIKLSASLIDWLLVLHNDIVKNLSHKKVKGESSGPKCIDFSGACLVLVLWIYKGESKYFSYFDSKLHLGSKNKETQYPLYLKISTEYLTKISNIPFEKVAQTLSSIKLDEFSFELINPFILNVLNAYDQSHNAQFLQMITTISRRLMEYENTNITKLNYYQLLKRLDQLTSSEMKEIFNIIESTDSLQEKIAAYILLNSHSEASSLFTQLSTEELNIFKTYPIFNLWNEKI